MERPEADRREGALTSEVCEAYPTSRKPSFVQMAGPGRIGWVPEQQHPFRALRKAVNLLLSQLLAITCSNVVSPETFSASSSNV